MATLFLSYSRKDLSRIAPLISALKSAGHNLWIDVEAERGGEQWRKQIVAAIESSRTLLIILSENSIVTDNVRRELDVAVDSNVPILPINLDQVIIPSEMKYQLAGIQRVDLSKDFRAGLDSLLTILGGETGHIEETRLFPAGASVATPKRDITRVIVGVLIGGVSSLVAGYGFVFLLDLISEHEGGSLEDVTQVGLLYGLLGAITGGVIARFKHDSRALLRLILVTTSATLALGIAAELIFGDRSQWKSFLIVMALMGVPTGIVVGMLIYVIVVARLWLSEAPDESLVVNHRRVITRVIVGGVMGGSAAFAAGFLYMASIGLVLDSEPGIFENVAQFALLYGLCGAITGGIIARFGNDSKPFLRLILVTTIVTLALGIAGCLIFGGRSDWKVGLIVAWMGLPAGVVVGMLIYVTVVARKWLSDASAEAVGRKPDKR